MDAKSLKMFFPLLNARIHRQKAIPYNIALQEKLVPDNDPRTINFLRMLGLCVMPFKYKYTSNSEDEISVRIICTPAAAAQEPSTLVQTLGISIWTFQAQVSVFAVDSIAHVKAARTGNGTYGTGVTQDGYWREIITGGRQREWIIEYSHGEFTSKRLAEVIRRHGRRPQLWLTPSESHAKTLRQTLAAMLPGYPHTQVTVVDWTGRTYAAR